MYSKLHEKNNSLVLACCDKELLGKTLEFKEISFKVSESFYGKELIEEKQLEEMLAKADSINLLGEKSVGIALRKKLINESDVIKIGSIPHAQIFKLPEAVA